jgi:hypothetical protein
MGDQLLSSCQSTRSIDNITTDKSLLIHFAVYTLSSSVGSRDGMLRVEMQA